MFDYLVIGGDAAGRVLAARLSDNPALDVALLEPTPVPPRYTSVPQPGLNGRSVPLAPGLGSPPGAVLASALARPNLQVFGGAQATRILTQGRRAVGVEFRQDGLLKQLRTAGEVLLCAGALPSPQLLLLSGIGDHAQLLANGIATVHHLPGVGLQLQDAVALVLEAPAATAFWRWWPWGRARQGAGLHIPAAAPGPDLQLQCLPGRRGPALHIRLLQPASRGSVRLHGKDPLQPPHVHPNLLGSMADVERLGCGFHHAQHLAAQPGLAAWAGWASVRRARSPVELEFHLRETAVAAGLPVGSCRSGPGGQGRDGAHEDVVDARLRVHGMAGLRVVDASVLPRIDATDPAASTAVLAEKAADMLREDAAQG